MKEVLGPEWGALAGMSAEEGLKIMSKYATDLESKLETPPTTRRTDDDDDDESPRVDPGVRAARTMHNRNVEPAATEFVGKREAARARARQAIMSQGQDWDQFAADVESAMANTTAQQQQDPAVWQEAWWYVWGIEQRKRVQSPDDTRTPPRNEPVETRVEVRAGNMNADRGRSSPGRQDSKPVIDDPEERRTKAKFERFLGIEISDDEWVRLQNEDINTYEQYQRLQEDLSDRRGRSR